MIPKGLGNVRWNEIPEWHDYYNKAADSLLATFAEPKPKGVLCSVWAGGNTALSQQFTIMNDERFGIDLPDARKEDGGLRLVIEVVAK